MHNTNSNTLVNEQSFSSLALREALLNNLSFLEYTAMTPIQAQSLPLMLAGNDVIAQAKTGSGKTAAFGLALLNSLDIDLFSVQALVLCPTRELAEQVSQALRKLARLMPNIKILNLSGGIQIKIQLDSLIHSPHIIVGTPGRVLKHLVKGSLTIDTLQTLVLDEADRMLDMGFLDEISSIIKLCPKARQTQLFSATYPEEVKTLASRFMNSPKIVNIENVQADLDIQQLFYEVRAKEQKFPLLKKLLLTYKPSSTLIFCNTKDQTTQLCTMLENEGFSATALNGTMEQFQRDVAIIRFKNQSCTILVATDVAARGLDIKELPAVINYDLAFEHDVHIHRIGRTGRAGSKGLAISITTPTDAERLAAIEDALAQPITWGGFDDFANIDPTIIAPTMMTISLSVGRKDKIRPGDILGALTKDAGIDSSQIGKIDITSLYSYVAVDAKQVEKILKYFKTGKVKGCKVFAKRST